MRNAIALLAAIASFPSWAGPAIVNEPALSTDAAMEVASAALAQCRKDG